MLKTQIDIEKQLVNTLEQIAKNPENYAALYIHASKLKPKHRHPNFLKILEKFFDGVIGLSGGACFPLSNGDFAILGHNFTQKAVDDAVNKLKQGLTNDPILHNKDTAEFAVVYNFPEKFTVFCNQILSFIENKKTTIEEQQPETQEIHAADIDNVIHILEQVDISELVKRQSIIEVKGANQFKVHAQEFFLAVKDLNALFDNVDLQKNHWLYFYILQHLDKRMLQAFFAAHLKQWPEFIGINLSLLSVFSPEFITFAKEFLQQGHKIIAEIQLIDIFNNLPLYFQVKDILHKGGHRILIDGVTTASLKLLNLETLAPDMIKIFWEPLLEYEENNKDIQTALSLLKTENIILAKCDSSKALSWGLHHGLSVFQGPFMDNLETTIIRRQCPDVDKCDIKQCLKRKRLLSGTEHERCTQKEILEKLL